MHPALSVILFTCASGGGYMLLAIMGLLSSAGQLAPERAFGIAGFALAFGMVTVGLISSTFHLGHPERAWRALSQWRSSWLSREGILALATFVPAAVFAWGWLIEGRTPVPAAVATAILAVATIAATAMIYATLKPIRAWNNGWTLPIHLAAGTCSGALWAATLAAWCQPKATPVLALIAVIAAILAGMALLAYWRRIDRDGIASSPAGATGLGQGGAVRPLLLPHTEENYLLKEMGFRIARKHRGRLRSIALWLGFIAPGALALLSGYRAEIAGIGLAPAALTLAALLNGVGTLVQRWLFFAEARHTIVHYYREQEAG